MLDVFLEVAYEQEKQASLKQQVLTELKKLPNEELHKIASGEVKIACGDDHWLDKFKCTPLYQQAVALEEQVLKTDIADQQRRAAVKQTNDQRYASRDSLNVKKRVLELDLRKLELSGGEPEEMPVPEDAVDKMAAERGALLIESMRKEALTSKYNKKAPEKTASIKEASVEKQAKTRWMKELAKGVRKGSVEGVKTMKGLQPTVGFSKSLSGGVRSIKHNAKLVAAGAQGKGGYGKDTLGAKAVQGAKKIVSEVSNPKFGPKRTNKGFKRFVSKTEGYEGIARKSRDYWKYQKNLQDLKKTSSITDLNDLTEFEKQALVGALKAGFAGAKAFVSPAKEGLKAAWKSDKKGQFASAVKNVAGLGARKAGKWATTNPGAAATLGAGALGTAAGAGYLAGR